MISFDKFHFQSRIVFIKLTVFMFVYLFPKMNPENFHCNLSCSKPKQMSERSVPELDFVFCVRFNFGTITCSTVKQMLMFTWVLPQFVFEKLARNDPPFASQMEDLAICNDYFYSCGYVFRFFVLKLLRFWLCFQKLFSLSFYIHISLCSLV